MDGAWRRPPKSMSDYGHTEPKRGAEWWGKSLLVTFGLFSKVTRRKGGTHSRRYLNNGYVLDQIPNLGCPITSHSIRPTTAPAACTTPPLKPRCHLPRNHSKR
ncbi:hypothetical protein FRT59_21190 [Pseudomonas haemolytica]|uniref:Uncharacterized protein n=1 Tax=Pseudomonas haemolytica TaxID=2600065 RepID=A0A5P1DIN9_9PSED|nr:hypothetical protein [Pseudomonas haemolytica]